MGPMSPVSRGRKKAKTRPTGSRVLRSVPAPEVCDCPECSGADDSLASFVEDLVIAGADLRTVDDPIEAELLGSALLGLLLGATAAVIRSTFDDRSAHQDDAPSEADDNEKGERVTLRKFVRSVRQFRLTFLIVAAAVFVVGIPSILLLPGRYVSATRLLVSVDVPL